jgi:acyl-CoA synthetase (AMP-forming)/AMP-acid ligase II
MARGLQFLSKKEGRWVNITPLQQKVLTNINIGDREVLVYPHRPKNLTELLDLTVSRYPDNIALVSGNQRLTFREFKMMVDRLAYNLKDVWLVQKGDRVALLLGNVLEFCISIFAIAQIGAITVPLNTRLKSEELKYMLKNSGSKILILEEKFWEEISVIRTHVNDLKEIFCVAPDDQALPPDVYPFTELLAHEPDRRIVDCCQEDERVFIMYTSGTTGLPKGAIGTHLGMIHSAINYQVIMNTCAEDSTVLVVPLFHVTGLIGQLIHMFLVGGKTVLMEEYKTDTMLQLMEKEVVTFSFVVPTIYVLMLLNANLEKYNLSRLRLAAYGGAPMSLQTIKQLAERFPNLDLRNAYGATETSSPTTVMPFGEAIRKSSSVGKPVPGAVVKVMSDDQQELDVNQVGELWIKGAMVVPGYWENPSANAKEFVDSFWRSGDLAKIDEEGFVYIMDRKKDLINRGGEKIFCAEVEDVLYSHPKVFEATVVGFPDPIFGEQVKAVIVPRPGEVIEQEEIKSWVNAKLADYKVPKIVSFVNQLPRNPGGKVIKSAVKDL